VKQEAIFLVRIVWDLCALDKLIDSENDCQRCTIKIDGLSVCPVILCLRRKYYTGISLSMEKHYAQAMAVLRSLEDTKTCQNCDGDNDDV